MQTKASQSNPQIAPPDTSTVPLRHQRAAQYQRVHDERKRPIRGLWVRNGRYYAQLTVEDEQTGQKQVRRVPWEGATTPAQASQKLEELRVNRRKGKLPVLKLTPKFSDFADAYVAFYKQAKDAKRASTIESEETCCESSGTRFQSSPFHRLKSSGKGFSPSLPLTPHQRPQTETLSRPQICSNVFKNLVPSAIQNQFDLGIRNDLKDVAGDGWHCPQDYFLSIVLQKPPKAAKSCKAHIPETADTHKIIVNRGFYSCPPRRKGVVVGDGFEPSKA